MRRLLISTLTSLWLLQFAIFPAHACLNDSYIKRSEKEFKSNYLEKKETPSPSPDYQELARRDRWLFWGGSGTGVFLLLGAVALSLGKSNRS